MLAGYRAPLVVRFGAQVCVGPGPIGCKLEGLRFIGVSGPETYSKGPLATNPDPTACVSGVMPDNTGDKTHCFVSRGSYSTPFMINIFYVAMLVT